MPQHLLSPLSVIDETLARNQQLTSAESHRQLSQVFQDWLAVPENLASVPIVCPEYLQDSSLPAISPRSLVRFRGMVQDTSFGQEVFISRYPSEQGVQFNAYRDHSHNEEVSDPSEPQMSYEAQRSAMEDRDLWYAVSTPGLTHWAKSILGTENSEAEQNSFIQSQNTKFPIPGHPHIGVFLKLYGLDPNNLPASVADLVDVVGVLGENPDGSSSKDLVIHVLALRKMGNWDFAHSSPWALNEPLIEQGNIDIRSHLLSCLTKALGGDEVAGEYLLLHLLGRTHEIAREGESSSRFTVLNLVFPENFDVSPLRAVIHNLLPIVEVYSMSVLGLNHDHCMPRFQDEEGGLLSGRLQLPPSTYLVIDELCMDEGILIEQGVKNLQSISELATSSRVQYVYPYFQTSLPSPMSLLILSAKSKSLIPAQARVVVSGNETSLLENMPWGVFRNYLQVAMRPRPYSIPEDMAEIIQNGFVEGRQQSWAQAEQTATADQTPTPSFTHLDLERQLLLARMIALSFDIASPEVQLTPSAWSLAQGLHASVSGPLPSSQVGSSEIGLASSLTSMNITAPPPCR